MILGAYASSVFTMPCLHLEKSIAFASQYASIVLWKSRWSSVRFVKMPVSNVISSARCRTSAWEDTSITQCVQPASTISEKSFCSSKDSGVVRSVWMTVPPIMF